MAHRLLISLILLGAGVAATGPALAQTPTDSPNTPAAAPAATTSAPAAPGSDSSAAPAQSPAPASAPTAAPPSPPPASPATPSADAIKKARLAGYHENKDSLNKPFMCAGGGCTDHYVRANVSSRAVTS